VKQQDVSACPHLAKLGSVRALISSLGGLIACACAPAGPGPQEIPNAGKADNTALILNLSDRQPRSLYLECVAETSCDLSFAASLRSPSGCELLGLEDECTAADDEILGTTLANLSIETPAGEVLERPIVILVDAEGREHTVIDGADLSEQPPGTYFVDVRRAAGLARDIELSLEARYGAVGTPASEAPCEIGLPEFLDSQTSGDRRWVALRWSEVDRGLFEVEGEGFEVPEGSLLGRYRAEVREAGVPVDPIALLERQRALYARVAPNHVPTFDAIIAGELGAIGGVACWEAAMMEDHLRRHLEQHAPNEFQAFLLTRGDGDEARARIYGVSGNMPWAPSGTPLWEHLEADLADGWELSAHLHNHFFFLSNLPSGDIAGTLIPSPPDRSSYVSHAERFGLTEARITNAFDSIRFPRAQFEELVQLLER
jgi:hypothetical protein